MDVFVGKSPMLGSPSPSLPPWTQLKVPRGKSYKVKATQIISVSPLTRAFLAKASIYKGFSS
jgi:hypothetical protein